MGATTASPLPEYSVGVQGLHRALDSLDAAVSLTQHHDAVTGTAKQAVTNDYARRLAAASAAVHRSIARLISAAIFTPHACSRCTGTSPPHGASELSDLDPAQRADVGVGPAQGGGDHSGAARSGSKEPNRSVQDAQSSSVGEAGGRVGAAAEAADGLPRLWPCEQGNMSACAATVEASRACESFAVVLFNSAAWPREENVRVRQQGNKILGGSNASLALWRSPTLPIQNITWPRGHEPYHTPST